MAARRPKQHVYGLLPLSEALASMSAEETCGFAFKHPEQPDEAGALTPEDETHIASVRELFGRYVDMKLLVEDLAAATANPAAWTRQLSCYPGCELAAAAKPPMPPSAPSPSAPPLPSGDLVETAGGGGGGGGGASSHKRARQDGH